MIPPCALCDLRLSAVRVPHLYRAAVTPTSPAAPSCPPCPVCLGILQPPLLSHTIRAVRSLLPSIRHTSRFKIIASFPPSASLLRPRAAHLSLPSPPSAPPISLREALKWTLGPLLERHLDLSYSPHAHLFVTLSYSHPETDSESARLLAHAEDILPRTEAKNGRGRKRPRKGPSVTSVARLDQALSNERFATYVSVPPAPVTTPATVSAALTTAPVLLAGSYNKLSRAMSQTPWHVDRAETDADAADAPPTTRTELSVQQLLSKGVETVLSPSAISFTAGGREDVDVRMLGNGRPFVLHVTNPAVVPELISPQLVAEIARISGRHPAVGVSNLRVVPKDYFVAMRQFETAKRKHYRCVVWTSVPCEEALLRQVLQKQGGFELKQATPLRVLHRRSQMVRLKQIYATSVFRVINDHYFILDVVAEAGTYIKEFIHGDNGRTRPNVAALLNCNADILQLDVTDIGLPDHNASEKFANDHNS